MRTARLFPLVVFALLACGGRTADVGSAGDGSAPPSNAYRVLYSADTSYSLETWHSNGASTIDKTFPITGISCTYDGRYVALSDWTYPDANMQVRDASGTIVRVQQGYIEALRPDGARAIVGAYVDDDTYCHGTLDVDGTYAGLGCFPRMGDGLFANAYAPDAKSVLWTRTVYDPVTTDTYVALEIGLEDGSDLREIAPLTTPGHGYISPAFNFDGSAVVYLDCTKNYDEMFCDLDTVDLATFATTTVLPYEPWILGAAFTPDGSSIVILQSKNEFLGSYEGDALRRVDLATREVSTLFEESRGRLMLASFCVTSD